MLLQTLLMFLITQAVMYYMDPKIFSTFQSWGSGSIFGILMGTVMAWESRFIAHKIKEKISWLNNPIKTALLVFTTGTICTLITVFVFNYVFLVIIFDVPFESFMKPNWSAIKLAITMYFAGSFIAHAIVFYIQWKNLAIQQEKQKHESLRLQFEALKTQVNPHFLFNSLNTLVQLIETDKVKAIDFTNRLSESYRYIIDKKSDDLVPLSDEMAFVESFLKMQHIRYGKMVTVRNLIQSTEGFRAIPVSIQILVENVFKHNIVSKESNITIEMWIEADYFHIKNNLIPKPNIEERTPTGLANIRTRYEYLTGKTCIFEVRDQEFVVAIPLIKCN